MHGQPHIRLDCASLRAIELGVTFPVLYFTVKFIWTTKIIPSRIFYSGVNRPKRKAKHSPIPATVFHNICGPAAVTYIGLNSVDRFDLGHRLDRPPVNLVINLLAPELFFLILAHSVYKMWIIEEPNMLQLCNKLHFEEKKNGEYIPRLKYSVPIFVE